MNSLAFFIKDLLFPKYCFGCAKLGVYLCALCEKRLKPIEKDICPYCGGTSYFGLTHSSCKGLSRIDGLKSVYHYTDLVTKIIKQIKYRLVSEAVDEFVAAAPAHKIEELFFYKQLLGVCSLIPVPLHGKRLKERGFNQSVLMARFFGDALHFPVDDMLVTRVKDTKPQAECKTPKDRYHNMRGAFSCVPNRIGQNIVGKKFIIFDDVWTTGWTIKEIAKVLKKHGAEKVFALTIAR